MCIISFSIPLSSPVSVPHGLPSGSSENESPDRGAVTAVFKGCLHVEIH